MKQIVPLLGHTPLLGENCFVADSAKIIGQVITGDDCSFWFNSVIRGDVCLIKMGDRCNIQDGAILHGTHEITDTILGDDVSVGHNAIVHGCTISDRVLIGMGAIVMDDVFIEPDVVVAAGALVTMGKTLKSGYIYAGSPAKILKPLDPETTGKMPINTADHYVKYKKWYNTIYI